MTAHDEPADLMFSVVINEEAQYSLWPSTSPVPEGWRAVGVQGSQQACLQHIEAVWTDMRPVSARTH